MKRLRALSTICISAMLCSGAADAQGFPAGCFVRDYSPEHLATHPEQGIAGLRMLFDTADLTVSIVAVTSYGGQALRDGVPGRLLIANALCDSDGRCDIPCNGGGFWLHRDEGETILIRTDGARVAERTCDPDASGTDLVEVPGEVTTYRLTRVPLESC
ncbi:hypothetical protein [Hasllibacter sp. MH4015]|uniref:hypothetical protein n=1 Tax=Hasllibacter sp. MH4015 TaxID=2854029 RepID=UPI001CD1E706|nr:hypothetical protein [Hasllibacter sp. MH4015]